MNESSAIPTMSVRDYLRIIFRHTTVMLICMVVILGVTVIGLKLETTVYEAQVKMLISAEKHVESPYYRELNGYNDLARSLTQSEIVKSAQVIERVARKFKSSISPLEYEKKFASPLKATLIDYKVRKIRKELEPLSLDEKQAVLYRRVVSDLRKRIKVEPISDTNLFTITATDFDPREAAKIANVVSRSYVIFDLEQQLLELSSKYGVKHPRVEQLKDNIEMLNKNLLSNTLPDLEAMGPGSVKIIEQAKVPLSSQGTSKYLTLFLALSMSLMLGLILAFSFEYLDQTFRSVNDISVLAPIPYLESIAHRKVWVPPIITQNHISLTYTRSYHRLADKLYLLIKNNSLKSLLVVSILPHEGADVTTANLGILLSRKLNEKVLIVDVNFRNPSMHKLFDQKLSLGLTDCLERRAVLSDVVKTVEGNLSLVTLGKTDFDPLVLLDSEPMREFVREAQQRYPLILFNSAHLTGYQDSVILAQDTDGLLLQVNENITRRQTAKEATQSLEQVKANVVGVILNNRSYPIPKIIYERNYTLIILLLLMVSLISFVIYYTKSKIGIDLIPRFHLFKSLDKHPESNQ